VQRICYFARTHSEKVLVHSGHGQLLHPGTRNTTRPTRTKSRNIGKLERPVLYDSQQFERRKKLLGTGIPQKMAPLPHYRSIEDGFKFSQLFAVPLGSIVASVREVCSYIKPHKQRSKRFANH
jgi:hypothetical protein